MNPYFEEEVDARCHVKRLNSGQTIFSSVTIFEYMGHVIQRGVNII